VALLRQALPSLSPPSLPARPQDDGKALLRLAQVAVALPFGQPQLLARLLDGQPLHIMQVQQLKGAGSRRAKRDAGSRVERLDPFNQFTPQALAGPLHRSHRLHPGQQRVTLERGQIVQAPKGGFHLLDKFRRRSRFGHRLARPNGRNLAGLRQTDADNLFLRLVYWGQIAQAIRTHRRRPQRNSCPIHLQPALRQENT
jgi:hypothetical protein